MSSKPDAIYGQDLASSETYDLTAQPDDLSGDRTPDLTQPVPAGKKPQPARPLGAGAHLVASLADPSPRRRAVRLALAMVLGRDEGLLERSK